MIRIYADFNARDEHGRVVLNTVGSLRDLAQVEKLLKPGMVVTLYDAEGIEVDAALEHEAYWFGMPNWVTLKEDGR